MSRKQSQVRLVCVIAGLASAAVADHQLHANDVSFSRDIQPILARRCFACHGPAEQEAGLGLHDRSLSTAESESGVLAIVPGRPEASALIQRVSSRDAATRMPPEGQPLRDDEIALLKDWIADGAEYAPHWSFVRPKRPDSPVVKRPELTRNMIDRFVHARLDAIALSPAPVASRGKLIRRLYLDLIGLLPPTDIADAFENGTLDYRNVVDHLLDSEHFGERWGRHWLDLARYADTFGYERDDVRPNAWRYRDWVIQSFNRNQPYNEFLTDQLAGDLSVNSSLDQRIATGLHRMNIRNNESGINKEDYRNREMADRVNTTGTSMLGLTLGCCQCHSHKYDPFSQAEYYQLYAFFNNIKSEDTAISGTAGEQERYDRAKADLDTRKKYLEGRRQLIDEMRKYSSFHSWRGNDTDKTSQIVKQLHLTDSVIAALRMPQDHVAVVSRFWDSLDGRADDTNAALRQLSVQKRHLPKPYIMALAESSRNRRPTHVLTRGDFKQKGERVEAGTPNVLPPFKARGDIPDRLDLARWIASPDNPLTARVAVNHIWAHLFGRGIVTSVDDFGTQGELPTHPDLLDWLSVEFMESGWDRKHMIRTIVQSATYRQSSQVLLSDDPNHQSACGPENLLFARQARFRVESEIVRDLFLDASGLLHREVGGPTIHPVLPDAVRNLGYKYKTRWRVSDKPHCYRRGLYIHFKRTNPYPTLVMFDGPESNVCQAMRNRSNTPLQALATLNDPVFVECAQSLGRTLASRQIADRDRLSFLCMLCLVRNPEARESNALLKLLTAERHWYREHPNDAVKIVGDYSADPIENYETAAWIMVARTVLNLDEFVTRE